jgi:flagellar protein FlgJ
MKIEALQTSAQIQKTENETSVGNTNFDQLLEEAKKSGNTDALRDATDQLEAVFINMMMKTMRSSIPESEGIFKKSESEKMFEEMLDDEYSTQMAKSGGIGISDMIFEQFEKSMASEDDKPATTFEMKG